MLLYRGSSSTYSMLTFLCLSCRHRSSIKLLGTMSREQRAQSSIMAPKKDKVPKINRVKKRHRRASLRKRTLKEKRGFLKRMQDEIREVRAETSSLKESLVQMLTELDDLKLEIVHTREINERVILHNTRTHQLLDLIIATILTGSGSVP
ncbi:uncharacterized protein LOC119989522 [Tripterygium wilfordii]|uniref:uncharacterized protein LOC119989522 n=1 Tax=Tripterygium wilfordii TaxID=458696 RepID=UPI0018F84AFA|nr:uncharacterized protein LOC119989522 [Tripterygium wilfordii]